MILVRPAKAYAPELQKHFQDCSREFLDWQDRDPGRVLNLRCSSLPFCPVNLFYQIGTLGTSQSLDMNSMYFTRVGTTVHTVMQTALVRNGDRIFGDWYCPKCKITEHMSLFRTCTKCQRPMQYEELAIDYRGIKGHVDTLFVPKSQVKYAQQMSQLPEAERYEAAKRLRLVIVDYKTCSISNSAAKKRNPGATYKSQIRAYAWLLTKQYGLQIDSTILMFLPRDNPNRPVYWEQVWTADDMPKLGRLLKRWKQAHTDALTARSWSEVKALLDDYGSCSGEYCKVCASSNVKTMLRQAFKDAQAEERLPIGDFMRREMGVA